MHINTSNQHYPISEQEIRLAYPNTSFSQPFKAPDEYAWVFPAPQPEHNPTYQTVREVPPVLTTKGHYEQQWEVVPRFTEYTDEQGVLHTVVEQEVAAATVAALATQASIIQSVQARLDTFAQTKFYDGILSACTYATSAVPKFALEGQYAVTARDTTWATATSILEAVIAGTRPVPSGYAEIEPELPVLSWPVVP